MSSEKRTSVPNSLNEHWMPFSSNRDFKANPRLIVSANTNIICINISKSPKGTHEEENN